MVQKRLLGGLACLFAALQLASCGAGKASDVIPTAEGLSTTEMRDAKAFLARIRPPAGFRLTTKHCIGQTSRCFTSREVVRPLTAPALLRVLREMGIRPAPGNADCLGRPCSRCERRVRAGRRLVSCDGFARIGRYNGGYAAWSSPSIRPRLAGTRITLSVESLAR